MEHACLKRNLMVCISVFAVLDLAILIIAAQFSAPFLSFDGVVERFNAQVPPVSGAQSNYRFQSCAGGGSVNCHTNGNLAGL